MNIKYIANNTLKVILTKEDLKKYNLTFDSLNQKNTETKKMISKIVESIVPIKYVNSDKVKFYIEAFLKKNGICILYITILRKNHSEIYFDFICKSKNPINFIKVSHEIYHKYSHLIKDSLLIKYNDFYFLKIKTYNKAENRLINICSEFSEVIPYDKYFFAFLEEHSELPILDNAIENLSEFY